MLELEPLPSGFMIVFFSTFCFFLVSVVLVTDLFRLVLALSSFRCFLLWLVLTDVLAALESDLFRLFPTWSSFLRFVSLSLLGDVAGRWRFFPELTAASIVSCRGGVSTAGAGWPSSFRHCLSLSLQGGGLVLLTGFVPFFPFCPVWSSFVRFVQLSGLDGCKGCFRFPPELIDISSLLCLDWACLWDGGWLACL